MFRLNHPHHSAPVVIVQNNSSNRKDSTQSAQRLLAPLLPHCPIDEKQQDCETAHFVITSKQGYGHSAKNIEIRFHII